MTSYALHIERPLALWAVQEGEEHLRATIRAFEEEGLQWLPLRERWRSTRLSR